MSFPFQSLNVRLDFRDGRNIVYLLSFHAEDGNIEPGLRMARKTGKPLQYPGLVP